MRKRKRVGLNAFLIGIGFKFRLPRNRVWKLSIRYDPLPGYRGRDGEPPRRKLLWGLTLPRASRRSLVDLRSFQVLSEQIPFHVPIVLTDYPQDVNAIYKENPGSVGPGFSCPSINVLTL
jgi:hypothetical protein